MTIHPQLLADCHNVGTLASGTLLLMRNVSLPWFIVVPDTDVTDLLDLAAPQRDQILADCAAVSAFIKQHLGFTKVNFAGLGNVVPQMHLHVIGRAESDACWPQPVWGQLPAAEDYDAVTLENWTQRLELAAGLQRA